MRGAVTAATTSPSTMTSARPPRPEQWEDFIAEAVDRAAGWPRWQTDGAAARAARVIEEAGR